MKASYSTPFERALTLLGAPVLFIIGKQAAKQRLAGLKYQLDDPCGRLEALDLVKQVENDCQFFGLKISDSGFCDHETVKLSAIESLLRYTRRLRKYRARLRLERRNIDRIPEHLRGKDFSLELAAVDQAFRVSTEEFHRAHKTLLAAFK